MARPPAPDKSTSVAVPILLGVLVLAFAVSIVREQVLTNRNAKTTTALNASVRRLRGTDAVACAFIVSDASTRNQQAVNANLTVSAQKDYIAKTERLLSLFDAPSARAAAAKRSPAARAAAQEFEDYLRSEVILVRTSERQSVKNIVLTQNLANTANGLATTLPCPTAPPR